MEREYMKTQLKQIYEYIWTINVILGNIFYAF